MKSEKQLNMQENKHCPSGKQAQPIQITKNVSGEE